MAPRSTDVATRSPAIALGVVLAVFALLPFAAGTRTPAAGAAPVVDNPHGKFREDCGECHGSAGWKPARITRKFDHSRYGFPLTGAHAASQCVSCHGSLDFTRQQKMCSNCHEDPHRGELGTACERCHNARSFIDRAPMLRAHQMSHFPLTGAHATLDCETCHTPVSQGKLRYVGTQVDCQGCHMPDYQAAKQPDHAAAAFPLECQQCHTPISWYTARFDHSRTRFPLTGAHVKTPCASCHGDGVYHGKSTDCYSCHQANYDATNDPPHAASGFGTTCATCHNTTSWAGAVFDHGATAFPLTGAHRTTPCLSCHGDGVYHGKSTDCYSCHKANYDATTDPKHSAAGFSTACATCHNTTNWSSGLFNHNATSFALTGAHVPLDCNRCHADNVFAAKSTDCYSCHKPSYDASTAPPHASQGFPTTCTTCHGTIAWQPSTFNHGATAFPLTGAHVPLACTSCHGDGVWKGKSTDCYSCHKANYDATTDPKHSAAGFSTACATCHNTTNWSSGLFNHNATSFALTGAHVPLDCNRCHADNVFAAKSTDCYSCHKPSYDATTNPNHAAAAFPTACVSCHNTTTWAGATFDHDGPYFPIYSGTHLGRWTACTDCHPVASSFANFTCLSCHPHDDKPTTDGHHSGVNGYVYDSAHCYSCHPRGTH